MSGSITDVDGVLVGHHHNRRGRSLTGTTVVFAPEGAVAAVDVRGGGPGTREVAALGPGNLVERVHAICLTGGSAFGLAAADGVVDELERRGLGVEVPAPGGGRTVVPVVPTAVIFDLGRGGDVTARPDAEFGRRALRAARRTSERGAIGAGTGARAGALQGGVGMASTTVVLPGSDDHVIVAALAVVNAVGSVIDESTGRPWYPIPGVRRPSGADRAQLRAALAAARPAPLNTTIGVVATDAGLGRTQAGRLALAAHDGLARAVRPSHALTDGDTVFALATGRHDLSHGAESLTAEHVVALDLLAAAAADVFATACTDAVVHATTVGDAPAYADLCPSAYR